MNIWNLKKIMLNDFVSKLQKMTNDGILTCYQIVTFARNNDIELQHMKSILQEAEVQVKDCEQTCVSLKCKDFKPEETAKK